MPSTQVQRRWWPYAQAAQELLKVDKSLLLGAIHRHELPAYEKPLTRGRTTSDPTKQHVSLWVNVDDVDEWVRAYWKQYV